MQCITNINIPYNKKIDPDWDVFDSTKQTPTFISTYTDTIDENTYNLNFQFEDENYTIDESFTNENEILIDFYEFIDPAKIYHYTDPDIDETTHLFANTIAQDNNDNYHDHNITECVHMATEWLNDVILHKPETTKSKPIKLPNAPKTTAEAIASDNPDRNIWIEQIKKELQQMDGSTPERKVLIRYGIPQQGPGMKTKWVFTITYDNNMNIKYKARLVVCGYSQIKFQQYNETYAPTAAIMILNLLLHIAATNKMHIGSFDDSGAYLEADNDFINYAWLDKTLFGEKVRVLVAKALYYGEKQAGKLWNDHFNDILINKMNFERCPVVPCLYKQTKKFRNYICTNTC